MFYSVVLAGGASSRMGRDKALLRGGGQTLLDRALALLSDLGSDRILISGRVQGYDTVSDIFPRAGPPGGLYSILDFIRREYGLDDSLLLVIPVDMPYLNVDVLAHLVVSLGDARAVRYGDEVFPCVLRASRALYDHLQTMLRLGTEKGSARSMRGLLAHLQARRLSAGDIPKEVFRNINRPEDWEQYLSFHL